MDGVLEDGECEVTATAHEFTQMMDALARSPREHRLAYYEPYPYQKAFHHAEGLGTPGMLAQQRAIVGANKVGKTYCVGSEIAMHLTGQYPDWWQGHRWDRPVNVLVAGPSNELTREVPQCELLGRADEDGTLGTGAIPKNTIEKTTRKPGVPNAFDSVLVRHVSGGLSRAFFRAYEQGAEKFMGFPADIIWPDEEPPMDVYSQMVRATFNTGGIFLMSFTPENGVTELVNQFLTELPRGCYVTQPTWDDDPTYADPEVREQRLAGLKPHERDLRSRGIPVMGSGLVYPILDDHIICDPVELPRHWPRIGALDWGMDHPFAFVLKAWDRDSNTTYTYRSWKKRDLTISTAASAIKQSLGNDNMWIPIAWPHDVNVRDKSSGQPMRDLFAQEGLNMLVHSFTNPPPPGQEEGSGGNGVEVGLLHTLTRMENGLFKVFGTCTDWFAEKRLYHRKEGLVVKRNDDIMSADRYAEMSIRHSATPPMPGRHVPRARGMRNW